MNYIYINPDRFETSFCSPPRVSMRRYSTNWIIFCIPGVYVSDRPKYTGYFEPPSFTRYG